jgi:membrane-associated protease RseP (regulator of RpoE activity)
VIVEAGGQPIALLANLRHALGPVDAGQSLEVVVDRQGQRLSFTPVLTDKIPVYQRRYLGLRLADGDAGLEITAIEPDSPAAKTKLTAGQKITHCDGQLLTSKADLISRIAVLELDQPIVLQVASDGQEPQQVELFGTTWPNALPTAMPTVDPRIEESMQTEVVEVVLGDFPNKSFAVIPPLSDARELGLLIIFPEPGEFDQQKTQTYWSEFCRDYGWIVAVIKSGNPRTWSREEIELAGRVLGRLDNNYRLDKSRTVIGGLGVGGRIALAAAANDLQRVSGVMTLGTQLSRLGWRQQNAPMQSIDFLFVGDEPQLSPTAQRLSDIGYAAEVIPAGGLNVSKWETLPSVEIRLWLEGLGRL